MENTIEKLKQAGAKIQKDKGIAPKTDEVKTETTTVTETKVEEPKKEVTTNSSPAPKAENVSQETKTEEKKSEIKTEEKKETPAPKAEIDWDTQDIPDDVLQKIAQKKGLNLTAVDNETPEQKELRLRRENAEFFQYSIGELGMKPEDFAVPETLKTKKDEEIVYEDFKAKQLKTNANLKEETIKKRFQTVYPINDFVGDVDDENYVSLKAEYDSDRADAMKILKERAETIRQKSVAPINNAKTAYEQAKKNQQLIMKADNLVNTFASQFGKEFIYKSEEGDIPIEIPSYDTYKTEFLNTLRETSRFATFQNPDGSFDLNAVAYNKLVVDHRKQIDGVIASNNYNKGIADGKKGFKNPLTESSNTGVEVTDKEKAKGEIISKGMDTLSKLGSR